MKDYMIYSLRVANILARKGFKVKETRINIKFPQYLVYYFEDTPELRTAIEEINNKNTKKIAK